ncbi:MAG: hypothetical protein ABJA66_06480 [Actinomycetota bacterium]
MEKDWRKNSGLFPVSSGLIPHQQRKVDSLKALAEAIDLPIDYFRQG